MTPARALLQRLVFSLAPTDIAEIIPRVNVSAFRDAAERAVFTELANAPVNRDGLNVGAARARLELRDPAAARVLEELMQGGADDAMAGPVESLVQAFHEWSHAARFADVIHGAYKALVTKNEPVATIERTVHERLSLLVGDAIHDRRYDDIGQQANAVLDFLASDKPRGVPFGYTALDRAVVAPVAGNLVTIAGATGTGKSTAARNILRNYVHQGRRVAWFTMEMTAREQLIALACIDAQIDLGRATDGRLEIDEKNRLWTAVEWWRDCGLLRVNDRGQATPEYITGTMRRYRAEGFDTFVVDHLHRVDYGFATERDLRLRVGNLARALKGFAMDSESIVLLLAQLVKKSPHDEPNDADIRETATIAEESDKTFFVYRPEVACERRADGSLAPIPRDVTGRRYFAHDAPKGSVLGIDDERLYLKLGKQRVQSRSGLVAIPFDRKCGRMYDPTPVSPPAAFASPDHGPMRTARRKHPDDPKVDDAFQRPAFASESGGGA